MDSDSAEKAKRRLSLPAKCFTAVRLFADSNSVVLQLGEQCAAQGPLRHTWIIFISDFIQFVHLCVCPTMANFLFSNICSASTDWLWKRCGCMWLHMCGNHQNSLT